MKRQYFSAIAALLTLTASLVACGDLAQSDPPRPLAQIRGTLTVNGSTNAPTGTTRVAIVWLTKSGSVPYRTAEDVRITPVFPASYHLELQSPPPPEAMEREGELSVAAGAIVAYQDNNGNGKLDLVDDTASSAIDTLLGTNTKVTLAYVEGQGIENAKPSPDGSRPALGYNLLDGDAGTNEPGHWTSLAVTGSLQVIGDYDLVVSAAPAWSSVMCKKEPAVEGEVENPPEAVAPGSDGWPAKSDARLRCSDDGTYTITDCKEGARDGLCSPFTSSCVAQTYRSPSTPPPAEWPCPVK